METFKKDVLEEALTRFPGIERLVGLMYAQDSWTMTPYILYILKNQPDPRERQRLFGYMETYLVRRTICKSKNNNYSDMFSENLIGQGVKTFDEFKAYVNNASARGTLLIPTDEELKDAILKEDQKRNANVLLYMLESKINESFTESEFTNGYTDFVVEQIMPEKGNAAWASASYSNEDREWLTKTIGNFVLLREKLKSADKKANWQRKKNAMMDRSSKIEVSVIVTRGLGIFNEQTIEKRNQWIAEKAIEAWPI
jgi:hypothetical protein